VATGSLAVTFTWRRRLWLHGLLYLLTFFTTSALGSRLAFNFAHNLAAFDLERDFSVWLDIWHNPGQLPDGLPYSLTLLAILTAHELGHWCACYYHGIDASLPFFLPAPTFIGTFGAFIRFRSAVKDRRELFDVGVAGPLAGFVFAVPALGFGLALSKVVPGLGAQSEVQFGMPLLIRAIAGWLFDGAVPADVYLHPVAQAAWVGLFATSLNLLPIGQLDGGHIIYACFGERHRWVSIAAIGVIALLGFLYWPWWAWAVVLYFLGRKHFFVFDTGGLGRGRAMVALLALLLFVVCFIPAPVLYNNDQGWLP
jgi:membrane-associated protease RseP (regulator of RpoE activity)